MKNIKKILSGTVAAVMLTTAASAYDIRNWFNTFDDPSLRDVTSKVSAEWVTADDTATATVNFGTSQIYLEAKDGYQFSITEVNAEGTADTLYSADYGVQWGTYMTSGYFNVYAERNYKITVQGEVSGKAITDMLEINEVETLYHIPEYYETYIKTKAGEINNKQDSPDAFSFVFLTDLELQHNQKHSMPMVRFLTQQCGINQVLGGGDWATGVNADDGIQLLWDDLNEARHLFSGIPMIKSIGAKDLVYGVNGQNTITKAQSYNRFLRDDNANDLTIVYDADKLNFYKDDAVNAVRYISVNTTADFTDTQAAFVEAALNVPSGWSVIAFSHKPVSEVANASLITDKVTAFVNGGGSFIAWISGSTHSDTITKVNDVFTQVTTNSDSAIGQSSTRALNTVNEQCFDVFSVDKANKTVSITRIGAGEDRSFTY